MRLTLSSIVLILLLAISLFSTPADLAKKKAEPNPKGDPRTPAAPPPLKKAPKKTATPTLDTGGGTQATDWAKEHDKYRKLEKMPTLQWSQTLYKLLEKHVELWVKKPQCEGIHPFEGMQLQRYGQNAAYLSGQVPDALTASTVVKSWYDQNINYNPSTKNCTDDDSDPCGAFTQLMWRSTQYFACRADLCAKNTNKTITRKIAMCWYVRPGNCNGKDYTKPAKQSPCGPYLPPR